jgi:hypothetical protein
MFFRAKDGSKIQRLRRGGKGGSRFLQKPLPARAIRNSFAAKQA